MKKTSFNTIKKSTWVRFASLLPTGLVALALIAGQSQADVVTFDSVADFTTVRGSAGAEATDLPSGQISLIDNLDNETPELYADFAGGDNVTDGFRLDFDVEFNNGAFTNLVSDPEILIRFSNAGTLPTSNDDTGFQLNFRHETDDSSNQVRATRTGASSTNSGLSAFQNVADGTSLGITALVNNALVDQDYVAFGGGSGTVAANTYDLFINGQFIQNYTLAGVGDRPDFDPAVGFGTFGLRSSGNGDLGTEVLFDNITIGFGAGDNGFIVEAVPEPSSAMLLIGGLSALGLVRRRKS